MKPATSPHRFGAAAALGLWIAAAALPSHAALFGDDDARRAILELRQKVEQLSEQQQARQSEQNVQLTEQLNQLRRGLLELNNQFEALRSDNARLRGENEQLARAVAETQRQQRDIQQGVEERIRKVEPQKVTLDGQEFSVDPEEKRLYEAAIAPMRSGDFSATAASLAAFQRRYPASGYANSVLFWLGNAQYGKRDCKEAMVSFRALIAAAPEHPRAPEALLSIANCQTELKDNRSARKTLEDLVARYPRSEAASAARERLVAMK